MTQTNGSPEIPGRFIDYDSDIIDSSVLADLYLVFRAR